MIPFFSWKKKLEEGALKGAFQDSDNLPFTQKGAVQKFLYYFSNTFSLKTSLNKVEKLLKHYDLQGQ